MTIPDLVCAHDLPADSLFHRHQRDFWSDVEEATSGRLRVQVRPWGELGPSREMLSKTLDGEVHFHPISGMPLSTKVPLVAIEGLPFAFEPEGGAERAMAGPLGLLLHDAVEKVGLHVLPGVWSQGHNQISNDREHGLRSLDDLSGFRIRTGQSDYLVDLYSTLGADPVPVPVQGIDAALAAGTAEGVEVPYAYMEELRVAPPQRSIAVIDIRWATFWMVANGDLWAELAPDLRDTVLRLHDDRVHRYRRDVLQHNRAARARLTAAGITFTDLAAEQVRRHLAEVGFYRRWRAEFGETAWSLLVEATGRSPEDPA